jgi:glycosyltransferase involved in cell wall biosynthesis
MTGIGQVAYRIVRALPKTETKVGVLLTRGSPYAGHFPGVRVHEVPVPLDAHPLTELFEQCVLPLFCRWHGYGSLVSFDTKVPLIRFGVKTFPYIHDLSVSRIPGSHNRKLSLLMRAHNRLAALTAERILTVSHAVAGQIRAGLGISAERIAVVHSADSCLHEWPSRRPPGVEARFFLAPSLTNPRKNLPRLLRAFGSSNARHSVQLVLTGDRAKIARDLFDAPVANVVNLGFVDEGELRFLYENAVALVYPSVEEGFGIPLLDAARFACPVLCSDLPVFRELMEDEASYFDPQDPASITAAMDRAAENPRPPDPRILRKFSWDRAARSVLEIATSA